MNADTFLEVSFSPFDHIDNNSMLEVQFLFDNYVESPELRQLYSSLRPEVLFWTAFANAELPRNVAEIMISGTWS